MSSVPSLTTLQAHLEKQTQALDRLCDTLSKLHDPDGGDPTLKARGKVPRTRSDDSKLSHESGQEAGVESLHKLRGSIVNLDKELRNFGYAAQQFGTSLRVLSPAADLRGRLSLVLFLFNENAMDLFPLRATRKSHEATSAPYVSKKPVLPNLPGRLVTTSQDHRKVDVEDLPRELKALAFDIMAFRHCFNEFPEFKDEALHSSLDSLGSDLEYWASCLIDFQGQLRYPAVQGYIHELSSELGDHIDRITPLLTMFIEFGIPTIRSTRQHVASKFLNLITAATLFSGVTATTLQFSYTNTDTPTAIAINLFWLCSLVSSVGAVVNSLLSLTWNHTLHGSSGGRFPWWVSSWIKQSPLAFLAMAVAFFLVGLVLFTFSSNQPLVVCILTSVLTAFTCLGIAAVLAWFSWERQIYLHRGQTWHELFLAGVRKCMLAARKAAVGKPNRNSRRTSRSPLVRAADFVSGIFVQNRNKAEDSDNIDSEGGTLPFSISEPQFPGFPRQSLDPSPPATACASSEGTLAPASDAHTALSPKGRFAGAVRRVMILQSASQFARTPHRQSTSSPGLPGIAPSLRRQTQAERAVAMRGSRLAYLVPRLRAMQSMQELEPHAAFVTHLQFSPDGRFLATASQDRTSAIFRVGTPFVPYRVLAHPGEFAEQVAWSPDGTLLLTKLEHAIKIWTKDGVCKKTIDRSLTVVSVSWLPSSEGFISVEASSLHSSEGSTITRIDTNGKVVDEHHFGRMLLRDFVVTADSERLLGGGAMTASATGLHPRNSKAQNRIVVYNLVTKAIEHQIPVFNEVRHITLSYSGKFALITYEGMAPPQLWKLEYVKIINILKITLRHTYISKAPVDIAGASYFGGKDDQLVVCVGKAGDIHIWDRDSAVLLRQLRNPSSDLTCVAWSRSPEHPFMFVTGCEDGALRLWTLPAGGLQSSDHAEGDPEGPMAGGLSVDGLDPEYNMSSPVTQQELEMIHGRGEDMP